MGAKALKFGYIAFAGFRRSYTRRRTIHLRRIVQTSDVWKFVGALILTSTRTFHFLRNLYQSIPNQSLEVRLNFHSHSIPNVYAEIDCVNNTMTQLCCASIGSSSLAPSPYLLSIKFKIQTLPVYLICSCQKGFRPTFVLCGVAERIKSQFTFRFTI